MGKTLKQVKIDFVQRMLEKFLAQQQQPCICKRKSIRGPQREPGWHHRIDCARYSPWWAPSSEEPEE